MTAVLPKRERSLHGLGMSRIESSMLRNDHMREVGGELPSSCRERVRERERDNEVLRLTIRKC